MIDLKKQGEQYFLLIGYDFLTKESLRTIPLSREETKEMADTFNEEFAEAVGAKELEWAFNNFRLTDAPDHPFGWTDYRRRTKLYYHEKCWHMIVPEIAEIGRLAKRALEGDE